jgi:hypothetical protein
MGVEMNEHALDIPNKYRRSTEGLPGVTLYNKVLRMTPPSPRVATGTHPAPPGSSILRHALLLGVAGDALLRGHPGLGILIWVVVLALAVISLAWEARRVISVQAGSWLLVAVTFSAGLVWRDSEALQLLDAWVVIGALGMAALSLSDPRTALFAERLRDSVWAAGTAMLTVMAGLAPLGMPSPDSRSRFRRELGPAVRATLIIAVFLLVFGSLLRDADPIFASLVVLPRWDLDVMVSHLVVVLFCAWIVGGWVRSALVIDVGRYPAPERFGVGLGLLDITAALGTLIVLFTTFVATQIGWFFGGERFLQERTGLTAAEYARGGFFQMVWVAALVVGVLLATRALLRPGRAPARLHTALSLPVVGLLAAIIVSAALRMRLYVHYYGLTTDRLYTLVFMGWLAAVLLWLTVTVLRGWGRPFVAGAVLSGLVTLAALNIAAPDVIVARVNLARAAEGSGARPPLDLVHLARLSGEAVELAVAATLTAPLDATEGQRCEAARLLLRRWGPFTPAALRPGQSAAWRFWNAGEALATRIIAEHAPGLRAVCRRS